MTDLDLASLATKGTAGFSDLREGDDERHRPFYDSMEGRLRKDAPIGCSYATAGFPPLWCTTEPVYEATLHDDYDDQTSEGQWWFCPEHAKRARTMTGWFRVIAMRNLPAAARVRQVGQQQ